MRHLLALQPRQVFHFQPSFVLHHRPVRRNVGRGPLGFQSFKTIVEAYPAWLAAL